MGNYFDKKSAQDLIHAVNTVVQQTGDSPTDYGWTAAQITQLKSLSTGIAQAITSQGLAVAQEKAATINKAAFRAQTVALLNALAAEAMRDPDVTDGMLAQIGFAPRRSGSTRPALPQTVAGLTAAPNADGSVKFAWDRGANGAGATFQIETSADGVAWTNVAGTPRASLTVGGFTPGVAAWFRVTTVNAAVASAPSTTTSIYAPTAPAAAATPAAPERVKLRLVS